MNKRELGKFGENIAANFLKNNGINIIKRNYFTKYGEIDLIGFENETIIFTEVKFRNNNSFGSPIEAITKNKYNRYKNAADQFLQDNNLNYNDIRFDIICIYKNKYGNEYKIEWLKNQYFI